MRRNTLLFAGLLLSVAAGLAVDNKPKADVDAPAAFARLKSLAGNWEAETSMGKARVSYELVAGGTVLFERETIGDHPAMLTMYHLDGNRLLLTHYCMTGNQPRMRAEAFDTKKGEVRFAFLDGTNMADAKAPHMHNATFRLVDKEHFHSEWEMYEAGQRKNIEQFQYTRVQ